MKRQTVALTLALFIIAAGTGFSAGGTVDSGRDAEPGTFLAMQFPDVAFDTLSRAEMDRFIGALPLVIEVLEQAGHEIEEPEFEGFESACSALVSIMEGIKDVEGVDAALARSGTDWVGFSGTMYKVLAASIAIVEEAFGDLASMFLGEQPEDKWAKNQQEESLSLGTLVPDGNIELVIEYEDELEMLGDLLE